MHFVLADEARFELARDCEASAAFPRRCNKPLCHSSVFWCPPRDSNSDILFGCQYLKLVRLPFRQVGNKNSYVVLSAGLEPATFGAEIRCSIQLSYESKILEAGAGLEPALTWICNPTRNHSANRPRLWKKCQPLPDKVYLIFTIWPTLAPTRSSSDL
jgi:hypothetical protein